MNTIKEMWEERSLKFGTKIEGVLPKSWPRKLNNFLDEWMYKSVSTVIPKHQNVKILDVGCGYGRLAEKILRAFPMSRVFGIDISENYAKFFNEKLSPRGRATSGDVRNLPYKDSTFDAVFVVTTLMYLLSKKDQKKAMNEIFRVLKKGGNFAFIERNSLGHNLINLFGLVQILRGESRKEINSVNFKKEEIQKLTKDSGGIITDMDGIPLFTVLFYPLFILTKLGVGTSLLRLVKTADEKAGRVLLTLSLYISYSGKKL